MMIKTLATLSVCAIFLGGCASAPTTGSTIADGCVAGAGAGALIGALVGGSRGAAIGAGIGAIGGCGVGAAIDQRRQQYANAEAFYEAQIIATRDYNGELSQRNLALERTIEEDQQHIAALTRDYTRGQATQSQLRQRKNTIDQRYASNEQALQQAREELSLQQEVAAEMRQQEHTQTGVMEQQVARLEREVSTLESSLDDMNTQSATLGSYL